MGKIFISSCLAVLAFPSSLYCQEFRQPFGAAYFAVQQFQTSQSQVFGFTVNQAALANNRTIAAGVFAEKKFLLDELSQYRLSFIVPVASAGSFGVTADYSGSATANSATVGLAYGRQLGTKLDAGLAFDYARYSVQGYGSTGLVKAAAGVLFHMSDQMHFSLHLDNPFGFAYGKDRQEKLPFVYTFGAAYITGENFIMSVMVEKEEGQPVNISPALSYLVHQQFSFTAGIATLTSSFWAAAGLQLKQYRLDIISSFHPSLGVTPGIAFSFQPKAGKN